MDRRLWRVRARRVLGAGFAVIALSFLCVLQAVQQAVLQVDEDGTVAAAVTEIGVGETAAPLPDHQLHFDRPFLLTISHTETAWPLFLAAIRDPRH